MAVKEDHLRKDMKQHVCASLSIAKLRVESVDVIDLDAFDVLHQNCAFGAAEGIKSWNIAVFISALLLIAEILLGLLSIDDLSLEVELLQQSLLEVVQKLIEIDTLVVIVSAQIV